MTGLGRAAARALLALSLVITAGATRGDAADWRDAVPEGWLAAAEVRSLPRLEELLGKLRAPWGEKAWPLTQMVPGLLGSPPADRPWGWAAVESERDQPALVFFVPTDDFDRFCEGIDADRSDDLAIGRLLGFEVAVVERDGWAVLTWIDHAATLDLPTAKAPPRHVPADVAVAFSPTGLELAAEEAADRQRQRLATRRGRRSAAVAPFKLPKDLSDVAELLTPTAPVFRELALAGRPISLGFSIDGTSGDLRLEAKWDVALRRSVGEQPRRLTAEEPIARADANGSLPGPLIDLALAWAQSQPAAWIEAAEFPQPQWDDFADAARDLLAGVRSPSTALTTPTEDQPLAANQAVAFGWSGEPEGLGDALGLAVLRWNVLVATAQARSPMRVALEPLEPGSPGRGWLLSIDVLAAAGRELIPEEKQVLEAFYGDPERLRVRITPRPDASEQGSGWLLSLQPPEAPVETEPIPPADSDELFTAELNLTRWLMWDHRIKSFGLEGTIGPGLDPPDLPPTAPAKLRVTTRDHLRLEATLPKATYQATTRLWNQE